MGFDTLTERQKNETEFISENRKNSSFYKARKQ